MPWGAAAGAIVGGLLASDAAGDAADTQAGAGRDAAAESARQFNLSRLDQMPWLEGGKGALRELQALYGLDTPREVFDEEGYNKALAANESMPASARYLAENADINPETWSSGKTAAQHWNLYGRAEGRKWYGQLDANGNAIDEGPATPGSAKQVNRADFTKTVFDKNDGQAQLAKLTSSPGYRFRLNEGLQGVERSAAARGNLFSGANLKALDQYGQDYATNEFGNYANRLSSLAGVGQTSANTLGALGQNYATNYGNMVTGNANAQGAAQIAQGNIWGSTLTGLGNAYGNYQNRNRNNATFTGP